MASQHLNIHTDVLVIDISNIYSNMCLTYSNKLGLILYCKPPTPRDRLYDSACNTVDRTRRTYALVPGSDDSMVIDPGGKSTQFL